jgi:hypothetical protein
MRIRIQFQILGFDDQKLRKKIYSWNFYIYFFDQKLQFTYPRPPQRTPKPSALKRDHPALQDMKILSFFYFCG